MDGGHAKGGCVAGVHLYLYEQRSLAKSNAHRIDTEVRSRREQKEDNDRQEHRK